MIKYPSHARDLDKMMGLLRASEAPGATLAFFRLEAAAEALQDGDNALSFGCLVAAMGKPGVRDLLKVYIPTIRVAAAIALADRVDAATTLYCNDPEELGFPKTAGGIVARMLYQVGSYLRRCDADEISKGLAILFALRNVAVIADVDHRPLTLITDAWNDEMLPHI